ncbi:hypothetical protein [Haloflavibacter putidus]|uniref:Chromosome partitioning protein ParA n=1 Tax=Haloflavibacter putidus TaxID=2576776 RepID=A0A508A3S3_9FLAO|nr:hypothetical protein [Haloflavibacter putidus]TQD40502.1 hypothetical protein FKR84_00560 [Haloflavibacter putidus]
MSEKKNVKVLQLLIIVLGISLIGLSFYTYNFYTNSVNSASQLKRQNDLLKSDLQEMQDDYQKLIESNSNLRTNLKTEQERIIILLDSLNAMELDFERYRKYRVQADLLKMEKKRLLKTVDSLTQKNRALLSTIDSTKSQIENQRFVADSILEANAKLNEKIEKASVLQLSGLHTEAVYLKKNRNIYATKKANKAEKIRVCFTVNKNLIVDAGEKTFFIQVINPKNNLMGKKMSKNYKKQILYYSESTNLQYNNEEVDVCILMQAQPKNLLEGRYIVNIFDGPRRLASTSFKLQ